MSDEVERDSFDLNGGFRWANQWQAVFFTFDCMAMLVSLVLNFCLIRSMARHHKESSITYLFLIFFFALSLVDDAIILGAFMSIFNGSRHQHKSVAFCRFVSFVVTGNRLLQAIGVVTMLYLTYAVLELKSKRIETLIRRYLPLVFAGLVVFEVILAVPQAFNIDASDGHCQYVGDGAILHTIGWLYNVLLPYFIPLLVSLYPFVRISWTVKRRNSCLERDRRNYQVVLSVTGSFFVFHFLYYLLWLGREVEALALEKSQFRRLLGLHFWFIARPLFSLINLGWHIVTPFSPFFYDPDLAEDMPGPWVAKRQHGQQEDFALEERPPTAASSLPEGAPEDKVQSWHEIHLPPALDQEYHHVPL